MIVEVRQNIHNPNLKGGFEKFGQAVYPNTEVTSEPPFINGRPALMLTPEEEKRVKKFLGVSSLEGVDGIEALMRFTAKITATNLILDLDNDAQFLYYIILKSIKALVAPNLEAAKNPMNNFAFYFYQPEEEIKSRVDVKKRYVLAIGIINNLESNPDLMISLAKYLTADYSTKDSNQAFEKLIRYVDGEFVKDGAVERFIQAAETDPVEINIHVDVKEAIHRHVIKKGNKLQFYNPISTTTYGATVEEVINFFLDPANEEELGQNKKGDKPYSIRYQLKNFLKSK